MTLVFAHAADRAAPRLSFGGVLYMALALSGWLATTALTTAGLIVVVFVLAGNGSLAGFFEQSDLLARHYLDADALRRATFDVQLLTIVSIIFAGTGFFRRTALIALIKGAVDGPRSLNRL